MNYINNNNNVLCQASTIISPSTGGNQYMKYFSKLDNTTSTASDLNDELMDFQPCLEDLASKFVVNTRVDKRTVDQLNSRIGKQKNEKIKQHIQA